MTSPEVTVWTSPERADFAARLLDTLGTAVRPLGLGGPRSAELDQLGRAWGCEPFDDFRKLRVQRPAQFFFLTTLHDVAPGDLRALMEQGTRVLSVEPLQIELGDLIDEDPPTHFHSVPAFDQSPGFLAAAEPHEHLAPPRLVRMTSHGRPEDGSLLARLIDGWSCVLQFSPLPETVDAQLRSRHRPTKAPPALRLLTGWLTAHGRVADGGSVYVEAADRAAASQRKLTVLSASGQLEVTDQTYTLHDGPGSLVDRSPSPGRVPGPGPADPVELIAEQWRRILQRPLAPPPKPQRARTLACVHACLLSARTGQPENVARLLQIGGV